MTKLETITIEGIAPERAVRRKRAKTAEKGSAESESP
jgi:hypothetical protein